MFAILMIVTQSCLAASVENDAMQTDTSAVQEDEQEIDPVVEALGRSIISVITGMPATSVLDYLMSPDIDHLSVGNPTLMKGQFFTSMWGNSTTDQDVRNLLNAYNLIYWNTQESVYTYDPTVVAELEVTENAAGDRTYYFTLLDDLFYSDGTPITVQDYAFSILLQIAPEIAQLGGEPVRKIQLLGYQDYIDGTAGYLAGVRLIDEDTIAITVDNEFLPYFFELEMVNAFPYPISVIAPGVEVRDDGQGAYLANIDDTVEDPIFTVQLREETIMDPRTGYLSHPSVVSGPYVLTSWDGETAEFEINEYYKGNTYGERPRVRALTFTLADNDTMVDELESGTFDVLNKVMNRDTINDGMRLVTSSGLGKFYGMSNYPRSGNSYISFACENPALSEKEVRQAFAWCMDREQTMMDYVDYYGLLVNGYYGVGQWIYRIVSGTILPPVEDPDESDPEAVAEYDAIMEAYEELSLDELTVYEVDLNMAEMLLERAGWKLNDDGIREKVILVPAEDADDQEDNETDNDTDAGDMTEKKITLEFTLAYTEGSSIAESFEKNLIPNLEKAGIKLELVPMDFAQLLNQFYYPEYREADMYFLATNFDIVFDPTTAFITETDEETGEEIHTWVTTGCRDEELYELAVNMRQTEPGDVLTYCQRWIEFQKRFNEVLPMLPIYSNIYFDFYTVFLHNYQISENISWGQAIVGSFVSGTREVPEEAEEDEEAQAQDEELIQDGMIEFDE